MIDRRPLANLTIEQQPEPVVCAIALCGEARGEQDRGGRLESLAMAGVLCVARNRSVDPFKRWPRTLRQVLVQPWQFSCFNPNDANRAKLLTLWQDDPVSWERADTVCDLFESGCLLDVTYGSTHYCRTELWNTDTPGRAWYSRQEIESGRTRGLTVIGAHTFGRAE